MTFDRPSGPRVLHAMLMSTFEPGIYQQLAWEQEAAAAEHLAWDVRIFTSLSAPDPAGLMVRWRPHRRLESTKAGQWLAFRRAYYAWLRGRVTEYDVVLVRHSPYDPLRAGAVRTLAKVVTVGTVHHTLDVPELRSGRPHPKALVLATAETLLGPRSIRAADVIIGVTAGIADYERERIHTSLPTLVYPNGAAVTGDVTDRRGARPELLFVAGTFRPWHGLDLLLDTVGSCPEPFTLHVVGTVDPTLAAGFSDPRVNFHGVLPPEQIRELSTTSWIGISSLGFARHRMEGSPLKVREYLSWGLPTYAGHRDVLPTDSAVFRVGGADIAEILAFAHETRSLSRRDIQNAAVTYIDKRLLIRELHAALARLAGR